jgi:hypothetical protein
MKDFPVPMRPLKRRGLFPLTKISSKYLYFAPATVGTFISWNAALQHNKAIYRRSDKNPASNNLRRVVSPDFGQLSCPMNKFLSFAVHEVIKH